MTGSDRRLDRARRRAREIIVESGRDVLQLREAAGLSQQARGFYAESRRVANGKLKRAADWAPLYPSYREGLASLL